jgi:poly(hydroxyalkanoate) depolymerase family esterase
MTDDARPHGMLGHMREATRLTRAGRVHDATALIQRTLRGPLGGGDPVGRARPTDAAAPARVTSTVVRTERTGGSVPPAPPPGTATTSPGRFLAESLTTRAGTRAYKVFVPGAASVAAMPLLVMLHGCTQDADDFAAGTRMNALAERHGFVVAYPEQSHQANPSRCWNWFEPADQSRDRGEPSLIADIARTVMASAHIDPSRVHAAGMSAGGAMAAILGAVHPDLFAAIGVHSGLAHGAATDLPSALQAMKQGGAGTARTDPATPAIVFHGDRDRTVHRGNAEQVLRQATAHVAHPLLTVHERAGAAGRDATRYVYRAPDGRTLAEGWSVHGLGHAWSGGDPAGSHTDPVGPDASAEMLRFFGEHPQRG